MRPLRAWFLRFAGLFYTRRREQDLADEMESHLQMHIDDNLRSGMSPGEARRRALIQLGGMEHTKELCRQRRGLPLLAASIQDLRYGIRILRKSPGFTTVAVLTLALGIGANAAIFGIVRAILLKPLPYPDSSRLVMIWNEYQGKPSSNSPPDYLDRLTQSSTLEGIAAFRAVDWNLSGTALDRVHTARVTASFFDVLGVRAELGRTFTAVEDTPGNSRFAVLSHGCWQRRFGSSAALPGSTLRLNGEPYTVLGVMPADFNALFPDIELWVPIAFTPAQTADNNRGNENLSVLARRKLEFSLAQVQSEMRAIAARVPERFPNRRNFLLSAKWSASVLPLREQFVGDVRPALLVLFAAVGVVLAIACANVANLLLARASKREKEIALRSALGASRGRIVRQLLVETVLLSALGGAAGVLLAALCITLAKRFGPAGIPLLDRVTVDPPVLLFLAGVSVLVGILFGVAPVVRLALGDIQQSLKAGGGSTGGLYRRRQGRSMIVAEFALSMILLAGAGLFIQSLHYLLQVKPGFETRNRLTMGISLPPRAYANLAQPIVFFRELIQRVEALPGVASAGAVQSLPFAGANETSTVAVEEHPALAGTTPPSAEYRMTTPGYRRAMGIPLLKGRDFDDGDRQDSRHVALVDEKAARSFWPNQDPLGKRFSFGDTNWKEVVGVVGTVHNVGLDVVAMEQVYIPYPQDPVLSMHLVIETKVPPLELTEAVRQAVLSLDRDLPVYDVRSLDERLDASMSSRRAGVAVLAAFAATALLLAAVGIFGVMAYSVSRRGQEIGVRMALGADGGNILRLVVLQGMKLALTGAALGVAGAAVVTRFLDRMLFGVKSGDPVTLAAAMLLLTVVALAACYIPARRATRLDPMVALRHE